MLSITFYRFISNSNRSQTSYFTSGSCLLEFSRSSFSVESIFVTYEWMAPQLMTILSTSIQSLDTLKPYQYSICTTLLVHTSELLPTSSPQNVPSRYVRAACPSYSRDKRSGIWSTFFHILTYEHLFNNGKKQGKLVLLIRIMN